MQGWVSIHRKIRQHPFYLEKRTFSKYEAWLDIILMANHRDNKFLHGNEWVEVERGSFITSELKLMAQWNWGKEKLRKFLKLLEDDGMIEKISSKKQTTIKVLQYKEYQLVPDHEQTDNRPQSDREQTINRPSSDTNNNVNNDLNNDEIKYIYEYWNGKNITVHKEFTAVMKKHVNARLSVHGLQTILNAIDAYAEIRVSEDYWYTHKFALSDFMNPKNLDKFLEVNKPYETFRKGFASAKGVSRNNSGTHKSPLETEEERAAREAKNNRLLGFDVF